MPKPEPLPLAVVLGLVLHRDQLAPFRPRKITTRAESLLAAQREDGFIGHTIFWNTPLTGRRRFTYNVTSPNASMTSSIQPPLLAWAWRIAVGDPATVPGIVRHYDWLSANRDLDGDGLIWIVQPDESGLDASPQFDAVWGRRAHDRPGFIFLVRRNRKLGYDLKRINAAGGPVCAEVATNVLLGLSLLALGRPSLTPTIVERMYDETSGLFAPLVRPNPSERRRARGLRSRRWLSRTCRNTSAGAWLKTISSTTEQFWLPVPPPSVPPTEPSFSLRDDHRYWRGPTWINAAWLVWLGLTRLGYREQAETLATRIMSAVLAEGLREYYDPYTGGGMGPVDFAWSSLVMEMLATDPVAAAGSYLSLPAGTD